MVQLLVLPVVKAARVLVTLAPLAPQDYCWNGSSRGHFCPTTAMALPEAVFLSPSRRLWDVERHNSCTGTTGAKMGGFKQKKSASDRGDPSLAYGQHTDVYLSEDDIGRRRRKSACSGQGSVAEGGYKHRRRNGRLALLGSGSLVPRTNRLKSWPRAHQKTPSVHVRLINDNISVELAAACIHGAPSRKSGRVQRSGLVRPGGERSPMSTLLECGRSPSNVGTDIRSPRSTSTSAALAVGELILCSALVGYKIRDTRSDV
jgi:hypothetical protein